MAVVLGSLCCGAQETAFRPFEYEGFTLSIPTEAVVTQKEGTAIVKAADGTFGMSIEVKADKKAREEAAVQICRRMVSELGISDARLQRVMVHGLKGARVMGRSQGAPITVLVLDGGKKYLQIVVLNTPMRQGWTDFCLDSVTKADNK